MPDGVLIPTKSFLVADLFCGAGGSSTGARRALAARGFAMDLVAVNHWDVAIETHSRNHPEARHYLHDLMSADPIQLVPEGKLDLLMASPTCTHHSRARGGKPSSDQQRMDPWTIIRWCSELRVKRLLVENVPEFCFPPETAVLTKRGMLPIGDIKIGDEVWTHNARWKPVAAVYRRQSPTVRVSGYGNSIIEPTPNHEFYVRQYTPLITKSGKFGRHEGRLLEPEWLRADRLADRDAGTVYAKKYSGYAWATPAELPHYWRRMPRTLGVDTDAPAFFYMLGRWLGDGWIRKRKGRQDVVRICANKPEAAELENRLAATGLTWHRHNHTESVDVFDLSAPKSRNLIAWLRANFGEYSYAKTLPAWIYGATQEQRWALIEGYHDADGNHREDGVSQASSVSRCLAVGIRLLLQSLGVAASIGRIPPRQAPAVGGDDEKMMKCRETFGVSWRREIEWEKCERRDLHIWGRIRSVEPCRDDVEVVDIKVADDHSFIADGQVVHNCDWGPIDPRTGRPIKSRKGETFRAWVGAIKALGGRFDYRIINCADYGDATTRIRFFGQARFDGKPIRWPAPTHSRDGGDLFGTEKWRAAREIIDWDLRGQSIFGRKKGLAPKTLDRIIAGAVKFNWPAPLIEATRAELRRQLLATIARTEATRKAAKTTKQRKAASRARDWCEERLRRLNAEAPAGAASSNSQPILVTLRQHDAGRGLDQPIPALCASGLHVGIIQPLLIRTDMSGAETLGARSVEDPVYTITTAGGIAVAEPFIAVVAHGNSEGEANPDARRTRSVDQPLQTIQAGGNTFALVEPFVLSQASGGVARGVSDPVPSIPCSGAHALICPYYGSGSGETCASVDAPLPTCTAKGRFGGDGTRARSLDEPLATITTAHRGELACIVAAFGKRDGQAPRVHSVDEPAPTICAQGRIQLAQTVVVGRDIDVLFRMLDPRRELARAMSFSDEDAEYMFAGTKTDITKQVGNAVPVRTATALVGAMIDV